MIENVGYLDQTKNVVTDEDLEFKRAGLVVSDESLFNNVGNNFLWYNKYVACFHGWLRMNECSIVGRQTIICKVPIKPMAGEGMMCGYYNDGRTSVIPIVDSEGNLMLNNDLEVSENSFIDFIGTFPISNGGGLVNRLKSLIHTFRKKVCVC